MPQSNTDQTTQPLRVLEIGTQFGLGGITRHILSLSEWLEARGHKISFAGTSDVWAPEVQHPNDFLELPTRYVAGEGGGLPNRLWKTIVASWKLRRWLARNPVDLIHAHESAPALVALIARTGRKIPIAISYHGADRDRIRSFGSIAKRCDVVITPSKGCAEELSGEGGVPAKKINPIYLSVPDGKSYAPAEITELRETLIGDGGQLIVTVARLMFQKGVDVLIDCVARMKDLRPDYRFVLVGDGPLEDDLKQLAAEKDVLSHLTFVGRSEEVHKYFHAADISLLTSRWEALGLVVLESFQTGTPAVATNCTGVGELIDEDTGRLAPVGDVEAICAALIELLSDPDQLASMGAAATMLAREERFQPDYIRDQFEQIYKDLAGRS